jgi:hypothetical protein
MMGPAKLSTIRAEVRKAFKMPDAKLLAWFNRQLEDLGQEPKANKAEMDTLRLLRDALVKETRGHPPADRAGDRAVQREAVTTTAAKAKTPNRWERKRQKGGKEVKR